MIVTNIYLQKHYTYRSPMRENVELYQLTLYSLQKVCNYYPLCVTNTNIKFCLANGRYFQILNVKQNISKLKTQTIATLVFEKGSDIDVNWTLVRLLT